MKGNVMITAAVVTAVGAGSYALYKKFNNSYRKRATTPSTEHAPVEIIVPVDSKSDLRLDDD